MRLPAILRRLADGPDKIDVSETTVGEALLALDVNFPAMADWVLDEQGAIRRRVAVFVNGERCRCDSALGRQSGEVFGSADGGRNWFPVAQHLPPSARSASPDRLEGGPAHPCMGSVSQCRSSGRSGS